MKQNRISRNIVLALLLCILFILVYMTVQNLGFTEKLSGGNKLFTSKKVIKIGFSLGTLKEERWVKDRDILMAKVKELGADIIVQNANNDDQDQLKQVKYLLEQGIDVLIIVPNDYEKASYAVELAKRQGVKVISYDRLVLKSNVDLYISFDNDKVGELMAKSALGKIGQGNVVVINGAKSDNNTKLIKVGYDKVLQPEIAGRKIKLLTEEWAPNWMKEYAFKVTDDLLQDNKHIDAVIAGNDSLAEGVIEALSEHRLAGDVVVVGQDADLAACQRIVEGTQLMTVYKPIEKLADAAAKLAVDLASNRKINVSNTIYDGKYNVPYYMLVPTAVDKNNIDDTIIKDGFHMHEEVYGY